MPVFFLPQLYDGPMAVRSEAVSRQRQYATGHPLPRARTEDEAAGRGGSSGFAAGVMCVILKLWSLWVLSAAHPLPVAWVDFQFTTMNCKTISLLTILIKETCKSFSYEC